MINLKISKFTCALFGSRQSERVRRDKVQDYVEQLYNDLENKDPRVLVNQVLGWLLEYTRSDYGYINVVYKNGVIGYKPVAITGISLNEKKMLKRFINIPLRHSTKFIATVGLGGKKTDMTMINDIEPVLSFVRDLVWSAEPNVWD